MELVGHSFERLTEIVGRGQLKIPAAALRGEHVGTIVRKDGAA